MKMTDVMKARWNAYFDKKWITEYMFQTCKSYTENIYKGTVMTMIRK